MTRGWSPIRRRSPSQVSPNCTPKHSRSSTASRKASRIASASAAPRGPERPVLAPSSWHLRRSPCRRGSAAVWQRTAAALLGSIAAAPPLRLTHRPREPETPTSPDRCRLLKHPPSCPPLHTDRQKCRPGGAPSTTSIADIGCGFRTGLRTNESVGNGNRRTLHRKPGTVDAPIYVPLCRLILRRGANRLLIH